MGIQVQLTKILKTWTTIDRSYNNFEGNIPSSIGSLIYLRQLNVSNNRFDGEIPVSFGNLSLLESLDVSSNQLVGTIPTQFTTLHTRSKLNLSLGESLVALNFKRLFDNDSYIGNNALCGHPLSRICIGDEVKSPGLSQSTEQDDSDFMDGFGWKSVLIGYGVGTIFGLGIGWLMFFTGKTECFIRFVEEEGYRIVMKRGRRNKISKRIVPKC